MDLSYLKDLSDRYTSDNSENAQKLPHLSVYRRHAESDMEAVVYDPVVCLILQGSKTTGTNGQRVTLETGDALLVSHDLPVVSRITRASAREPYIAVLLSLDLGLVRSLSLELDGAPPAHGHVAPLAAGPADPAWLAPLIRYFELMDDPRAARVLGPAILREIHFRLLLSDLGGMLGQLMFADSHASLIARAIQVIRNDFRSQLSIPDLARTAGMSGSSFHSHFKSVTGTTPLQFQKDLRLIEARAQLHGERAERLGCRPIWLDTKARPISAATTAENSVSPRAATPSKTDLSYCATFPKRFDCGHLANA